MKEITDTIIIKLDTLVTKLDSISYVQLKEPVIVHIENNIHWWQNPSIFISLTALLFTIGYSILFNNKRK